PGSNFVPGKGEPSSLLRAAQQHQARLASDGSGGYVFPDHLLGFDAIFTLIKLLELLAGDGRAVSAIRKEVPRAGDEHRAPAVPGARGQSSHRERRFVRTAGFFRALPPLVEAALPTRLKGVSHRARSSQAQWFFGDPRLHFEAWWHANTGRLELGLHLEAE